MIEYNEFLDLIDADMSKKPEGLASKMISLNILHTTERNFGVEQRTFVSLKLDIVSLEALFWVLKSLKNDEMAPNEKTIQSRVKEAFGYKINTILWDKLVEAASKHQAEPEPVEQHDSDDSQHQYTNSNP